MVHISICIRAFTLGCIWWCKCVYASTCKLGREVALGRARICIRTLFSRESTRGASRHGLAKQLKDDLSATGCGSVGDPRSLDPSLL